MRIFLVLFAATAFAADYLPADFADLARSPAGDLSLLVTRYSADERNLLRFHDLTESANRDRELKQFYSSWRGAIERVPFDTLSIHGKADYLALRAKLDWNLMEIEQSALRRNEIAPFVPFLGDITDLQEARQRVDPVDPAKAAARLDAIDKTIARLIKDPPPGDVKRTIANRASRVVSSLRETMKAWAAFYQDYDPLFTWWVAEPAGRLDKSLERYAKHLREDVAKVKADDRDTILGDPAGREALLKNLTAEMIPYTPEQLITIAGREFAWCEAEMKKASRELGFGDDWKRALEHVKTLHVPPGEQTQLVRTLAREAIDYVEANDLVTVPPLARDTWRMFMMSPERQRLNPFFLGGDSVIVSFPTSTMSHEEKMMSMRGNNIHFSRSTVFHELIPGHNLQAFMRPRYRPYRGAFDTPFWTEGWALYWEMILWDMGFPKTPENRVGMLFWRMHRCARIVFSLSFHLEKMTARECVDYLVDRVGFERENAAGEVRRSFESRYPPLYQVAYMLGALQFRALRRELVETRRMTNRQFHDAILHLNSIPVELIRATLTNAPLTRGFQAAWPFYGEIPQ